MSRHAKQQRAREGFKHLPPLLEPASRLKPLVKRAGRAPAGLHRISQLQQDSWRM